MNFIQEILSREFSVTHVTSKTKKKKNFVFQDVTSEFFKFQRFVLFWVVWFYFFKHSSVINILPSKTEKNNFEEKTTIITDKKKKSDKKLNEMKNFKIV